MLGSGWRKTLGYWAVVGLVGLGLLTVLGWSGYVALSAYQQSSALLEEWQKAASQIQRETAHDVSEFCDWLSPASIEQCVADKEKAAREKEQANTDLYAQREMANWAYVVAVTGLVSILLSLAGILFVWRSLRLNRDAVRAAVDANANTLSAIKQEREHSEVELRAYITVAPGGINPLKRRQLSIGHVTVENVGSVIAKDVRIAIRLDVRDSKEINTLKIDETSVKHIGALPPRSGFRRGTPEVVNRKMVSSPPALGATTYIYVWGRIDYLDGFHPKHRHTWFCHRYDVESGTIVQGRVVIGREAARFHSEGNDAT